jgi:hypothetical protein
VDGWALALLSEANLEYASTCQTIGMNCGYFTSFTAFLALNNPGFCNRCGSRGRCVLCCALLFWLPHRLQLLPCVPQGYPRLQLTLLPPSPPPPLSHTHTRTNTHNLSGAAGTSARTACCFGCCLACRSARHRWPR